MPTTKHKANLCGTHWIKIASSLSYHQRGSSGNSSLSVRHGEVVGGNDFVQCRAVKEPLHKVLGRALLTFTELNTLLIKIEDVINSRPLTAVSDDHRDPSPISPAHLAIGRSFNQLPDIHEDSLEMSSKRIMERYLYLQRLFNHYWKRWKQEYLHQLTVRNKWHKEEGPIKVGDIVLVSDDKVSRGKWPLARVEEVHPGRDNLVRTTTV